MIKLFVTLLTCGGPNLKILPLSVQIQASGKQSMLRVVHLKHVLCICWKGEFNNSKNIPAERTLE